MTSLRLPWLGYFLHNMSRDSNSTMQLLPVYGTGSTGNPQLDQFTFGNSEWTSATLHAVGRHCALLTT